MAGAPGEGAADGEELLGWSPSLRTSKPCYASRNSLRRGRALDRRRFRDWLEVLADDFVYKMPARHTVYWKSLDEEFEDLDHGMQYFDENKESMSTRVYKLDTNMAWPKSRQQHAQADHQHPGQERRR